MRKKLPQWLKKRVPCGAEKTQNVISHLRLNTVCVSAHCPNRGECFSLGEATFMMLGNVCTRNCRFCAVQKGIPLPVDIDEPERIVCAVNKMGLKYAVITSVTRDDLEDGGARQFIEVVRKLRDGLNGTIGIELLISDLGGNWKALKSIVQEDITVLNHNLETVERLYPVVRPQANYQRSLELLKIAKGEKPKLLTKSGLMVGLGETDEEVKKTMGDLRRVECDFITIGQYLQPGPEQLEVAEFITPRKFEEYRQEAIKMGFSGVESGPFVRSSYNAMQMYQCSGAIYRTKNVPINRDRYTTS